MTAKFAVADDQKRTFYKRIGDLIRRHDREDDTSPLDPAKVNDALQAIAEGKFGDAIAPLVRTASRLIHGMFVSCEEQVENVRKWNKRFCLGFSEEQLAEALATAPVWPTYSQFTVAVLVAYLATVGQTLETLWDIASRKQHDRYRFEGLRSEPERLRLLKLESGKIEHKPGLRWEVIDLAANWDKKDGIRPVDVRDPKTSPHAGILAAAAHFPKWVRRMDGTNVPFVWLSGYEATIPDCGPWTSVPILAFAQSYRQIRLHAYRSVLRDSDCAVPQFRE